MTEPPAAPPGFQQDSLAGARILVTRARHQAAPLVERLEMLGASVATVPTIRTAPPAATIELDRALQQADRYAWLVFTSPNGVAAVWQRLQALALDPRCLGGCRVAAVGEATAEALRQRGMEPDLVPDTAGSQELAALLLPRLQQGERLLLPRSQRADQHLPQALAARGARPESRVAYRTLPAPGAATALRRLWPDFRPQLLPITSPSALAGLRDALVEAFGASGPRRLDRCTLVAIGSRTARACQDCGLAVHVAPRPDLDGLVAGLVDVWQTGLAAGEQTSRGGQRGDASQRREPDG